MHVVATCFPKRSNLRLCCSPLSSDDDIFTVGTKHAPKRFRCAEVLFLPMTYELTGDIIITVGAILLPAQRHMNFLASTSPLLTSNVSVHIIVVPAVRSAKGIRVTPFLNNIRCDVIICELCTPILCCQTARACPRGLCDEAKKNYSIIRCHQCSMLSSVSLRTQCCFARLYAKLVCKARADLDHQPLIWQNSHTCTRLPLYTSC